jgi:hypothetical protein
MSMRLPSLAASVLIAATAAGAGLYAGYSIAGQPQMESALSHLQAAEHDLREATHDKGGHRDRALELVNRAEEQVREGMKYDRKH